MEMTFVPLTDSDDNWDPSSGVSERVADMPCSTVKVCVALLTVWLPNVTFPLPVACMDSVWVFFVNRATTLMSSDTLLMVYWPHR